ncbi:MAG: peptidylprolyl isomerase [Bryobacteraceae bacterium]
MTLRLSIALLMALCIYAQTQTPPAGTPPAAAATPAVTLDSLPGESVVATIDGKGVTAAELQSILRVLPPAARQQAMRTPRQFLEQFGLLRKLSQMAEAAKLYDRSPLKEQIEYNRMVALAQAQLMEEQGKITVPAEDVKKAYEADKDKYTQAKLKVIYIPYSTVPSLKKDPSGKTLTEPEAKAKATKLVADARGGADFVKLVKAHSGDPDSAAKDGDFGPIKKSDRIPEAIRVIFDLKAGEISDPIRQANGYYIFRVQEIGVQPFAEVENQVSNELRQQRFNDWIMSTQKSIPIKIENEAVFAAPAAPQPQK